jgi:hypothetical protein
MQSAICRLPMPDLGSSLAMPAPLARRQAADERGGPAHSGAILAGRGSEVAVLEPAIPVPDQHLTDHRFLIGNVAAGVVGRTAGR